VPAPLDSTIHLPCLALDRYSECHGSMGNGCDRINLAPTLDEGNLSWRGQGLYMTVIGHWLIRASGRRGGFGAIQTW